MRGIFFLLAAMMIFFPLTAKADVFGFKMDESPDSFPNFKLESRLPDGTEAWVYDEVLPEGAKEGKRNRNTLLIFTDGKLSEFFIRYFGHGKNLAQSSDDYSAAEKYIANLLMLDPEKYGKYRFYGTSESLGPNHRLYKSFMPEHNKENLCEIETILGPKNGEETETRIHVVFTNSKVCGIGPAFY